MEEAMKHPRSTHSDLAAIIEAHAKSLAKVPAAYMVSDASTIKCLNDAANILRAQDQRIGELTIGMRELRYGS